MGQLHLAVAEKLIASLDEDECDPRVITAAIAFLNNNKVIMNPYITDAITDIQKKLMSRTQRFKVVSDSKEAAEKIAAER